MRTENTPSSQAQRRCDYKAPPFLAPTIHLSFDIHDNKTKVISKTTYKRNPTSSGDLLLNGDEKSFRSLMINDHLLTTDEFILSENKLTIKNTEEKFGAEFVLTVETEIVPENNTSFEGLYASQGGYYTQCEAHGFRNMTFFQDRPDVMSIYTTRMEASAQKCPVMLSNGNLIEHGQASNGRHYSIWHDPYPKSCYLFALVASDLCYVQDSFTTMSGRIVDLRIYVRNGDQDKVRIAMEALKKSMQWDEDNYGREYQLNSFNIVAVSDFNMGAMENTSLNIFNTMYVLAHPDTATDDDIEGVEAVIAHEYFHNWSGNLVTCRDWFQLTLKEGFTVFRDAQFTSDMLDPTIKRIEDVIALRMRQFPQDAGPLAHPIRPELVEVQDNFYTSTVYEKGAEIIRMMQTIVGKDVFRAGCELYFERHFGQAVTCDDFVQAIEDQSGIDLTQFRLWYSQAGTPTLKFLQDYNPATKSYKLTVSQSIPKTNDQTEPKQPMHFPIVLGLISPQGHQILETTLHVTKSAQDFVFEGFDQKPVPSFLRDFSAPVHVDSDLTYDECEFLIRKDTNSFNRWFQIDALYHQEILSLIHAQKKEEKLLVSERLVALVGSLIDQALDQNCDKAIMAKLLRLPSYAEVTLGLQDIDPAQIENARQALFKAVAERYHDPLLRVLESSHDQTIYSFDPPSIAKRSLKESCLSYLRSCPNPTFFAAVQSMYQGVNNMTDRDMLMRAVINSNDSVRAVLLSDFYTRFKDQPLVIDKWFRYQAQAQRPSALQDVRELLNHPDFTFETPNRTRSLINAFVAGNPVAFHAQDGSGYEFFKEMVLKIDPINKQNAARLVSLIEDWRNYTKDRQNKMAQMMDDILSVPSLSANVRELLTKIRQASA
jgi:aminopeptidase N